MKNINQKRKIIYLLLLFMCLTPIVNVQADEREIRPFIKGSFEQIKQAHQDKPYIIVFWSESCAFCMKELALLGQLIKQYPNVEIVSISTDPFLKDETVKQILSSKQIENFETWVFADDFVERLYFDIDPKWRGELPLTYFFDKNHKMLRHMGVIKEKELIEWLSNQT
jgi:thiol-disulfide isomerase/thioredoxin